ncbi:MAG: hypothetical protein OEY78_09105 [Gammaproteobacteria bacterium]|nr:hypothetical protein [Gammaproteobacteria bacterium]
MSQCCSQNRPARKLECPINKHEYVQVAVKTLLHHLKEPWNYSLKDHGYYFCNATDCDVAYFSADGLIINKSELRTPLAAKEECEERMICYCFGISLADAKANPAIKNFVIQQTKLGNCACETSNPSGRCCLKDFPS